MCYSNYLDVKTIALIIFLAISLLTVDAQNTTGDTIQENKKSRRELRKEQKEANKIVPAPELTDPPFIDYTTSTVYITVNDSISEDATIRRNFTDQFISVWSEPGRIYPASKIFGIKQQGKYFRAGKIDPRNSVFGEQIVKGKINLYYTRRLPQEAGLVEMISTDPKNTGYRNFMIMEYEDRARYESDFYYFITLASDSLKTIPVTDYAQTAELYLKDVPEAYNMLMDFAKKRKSATKFVAPIMASSLIVAVLAAPTLGTGLLISAPVIGAGMGYSIYRKKHGLAKPMPDDMARIFSLYNLKKME